MIFECLNCFARPKNHKECELCGLPVVYAAAPHVIDLTLCDRPIQEYLEASWFEDILSLRQIPKRCVYCGEEVVKKQPGLIASHCLSKDHVIPISRGGLDILWNTAPACERCNRMKGTRTAAEFIKSRPGLCKSASLRIKFQQELFLYISGVAPSKNIDLAPRASLPPISTAFYLDRRRILAEQAQILKRRA